MSLLVVSISSIAYTPQALSAGRTISQVPSSGSSVELVVVHTPVLGSKHLDNPHSGATGWGTPAPRMIFNGGDPSGRVTSIRWHRWGRRFALGFGRTYVFRPKGGYYGRMVEAELRPSDLGRCSAHGPLAYRHLVAREPSKPGGPLGKWFGWAGWPSIC